MSYDEPPAPIGLEKDRWGNPKSDDWWLDSECSLLCPKCALESDNYDEVPQFRPVTKVSIASLSDEETCCQCSVAVADC